MQSHIKAIRTLIPAFTVLVTFSVKNTYGSAPAKVYRNNISAFDNLPLSYLPANEFIKLSVTEFGQLTGKRLNFFQRLSFRLMKIRMKHDLKKNPGLKITDYMEKRQRSGSIDIVWFLPAFLAPIAGLLAGGLVGLFALAAVPVIIAYATKQDRQQIKSVWLGVGSGLLLVLVIGLIAAISLSGGIE